MCLIRPPGRPGLALAGLGRVWHRSLSAACTLYTSLSLGPTQGHAVPLFGVVEVGLHEIAELQPAVDWNVWWSVDRGWQWWWVRCSRQCYRRRVRCVSTMVLVSMCSLSLSMDSSMGYCCHTVPYCTPTACWLCKWCSLHLVFVSTLCLNRSGTRPRVTNINRD